MTDNWYKRVIDVLRLPTLMAGAVAASTGAATAAAKDDGDYLRADDPTGFGGLVLPNTLNATATDIYAAHSSHRSHGSHRSHRSSSGGGSVTPRPAPTPSSPTRSAPAPRVTPSQPQTGTPPTSTVPKATPQDLSVMTVRVQAALMRLGHFDGDIDGILGPKTRAAIIKYQKAQGLRQTGRMDIDTLTRLGISIP